MVGANEAREIASGLAGVTVGAAADRLIFEVGGAQFAWSFLERLKPKAPRRPRLDILAVRCPLEEKEMLIAAAPAIYFDDEHYRGFPAVLVRLAEIEADALKARLERGAR